MEYTERKAARGILLTPQQEVLLMRMAFPWRDEDLWILPGGGIEPGEDAQAAVVREVFEETGATDVAVIGEAWYHESLVETTRTHLKQRYFLIHVDRFEPEPADLSEKEMEWVREYRWWAVSSLVSSRIVIEPPGVAGALRSLLEHGLPAEPVEIGTAFDPAMHR